MTPVVRTGATADADAIIDVITLAFSADPMARWSLPDPHTYLAVMPAVIRAFGERAFDAGTADVVDGFRGAALWLPPGAEPDGEQLASLMETHAPASVVDDMQGVFDQMAQFHPHDPHWYLPLIGVDPAAQGQGLGAMLLKHALARIDAVGLPAYLESSNPRNISLYQRHGFEILGRIQVGSSPLMTPMLRNPQ
jgi:ribosomal protein S18 acetylase RimI-like enzyme